MVKSRGCVFYLNRLQKAKMIEAFLQDFLNSPIKGYTILDIGCGNGDISDYFAEKNNQYAVDIEDARNKKDSNVRFRLIDSEQLPYNDNFFDIVLSHHVIEHVKNQDLHLKEIHRVLKRGGICYLGTPNKSSPLMEGHKGDEFTVLKYKMMKPFFHKHGFRTYEYSVKMMKDPSRFFCEIQYGRFIPTFLLNMLKFLFPSHSFILKSVE